MSERNKQKKAIVGVVGNCLWNSDKYYEEEYVKVSFCFAAAQNANYTCITDWPFSTFDSRYLEVEGTLWITFRYPYVDISDLQNWGKYQRNNQISQMNM